MYGARSLIAIILTNHITPYTTRAFTAVIAHIDDCQVANACSMHTADGEETFIEMWHNSPILYDNNSKGYSHRVKKLEKLTKIAEHFNTTGNNV